MHHWLLLLLLQAARDTAPRIEVRGVEVSGAWLGLSARSYVAVFLRGPEGIRLLSPDSATTWTPLDTGTASVPLEGLPSAALAPVNCVVTARRASAGSRVGGRSIKAADCGRYRLDRTRPGDTRPAHQGAGDPWYIPAQRRRRPQSLPGRGGHRRDVLPPDPSRSLTNG
jgi:hypothetical protein